MSYIALSTDELRRLSPDAQAEITNLVLGKNLSQGLLDETEEEHENLADLTPALTRKLISGLGDKTKSALRKMVEAGPSFCLSDVIASVPDAKTYMDIRGIWAALTKRTRTVTGDPDAVLIWWLDDASYDEDDMYVDQTGEFSPMTYRSLKAYFT